MQLEPLLHRVYVKPHEADDRAIIPEDLKKMGFIVRAGMDESEIRRNILSFEHGVVAAIGPTAFLNPDYQGHKPREEWTVPIQVGDEVIFGKYAGKLVQDPSDNNWYFLLNDEDIQSRINSEPSEAPELTEDEKNLLAEVLDNIEV